MSVAPTCFLRTVTSRPSITRPLAVVVTAMFVVFGFLSVRVIGAETARATPVVVAEPTDPTVPVTAPPSSSPPSTAPTTPPTTPPATVPSSSEPPVTEPPVTEPSWTPPPSTQWTDNSSGSGNQVAADPTTTIETTMTTTQNLLVGPPPSTVTTTTIPPQDLSSTAVTRSKGGSDPVIWAIAFGLALAGLGLGATTYMYWKRTRPAERGTPGSGRSRYSDLVITVPKAP